MTPRPRAFLLLAALLAAPLLTAGCLLDEVGLVGTEAPEFRVQTLDGAPLNLSDFRGKPVILDLMATWCGPCKEEVSHLLEIQRAYGDRVAIVSIGADRAESADQLRAFQEHYGTAWPMARDTDNIREKYELSIIPLLVVVGSDGHILLAQSGVVYPATIADALARDGAAPDAVAVDPVALAAGAGAGLAAALLAPLFILRLRGPRNHALQAWAIGIWLAVALAGWWFSGVASKLSRGLPLVAGAGALLMAVYSVWKKDAAERAEGNAFAHASDWVTAGLPFAAGALLLSLKGIGAVAAALPLAAFALAFVGGALAAPKLAPRVSLADHRRVAAFVAVAYGAALVALFFR